MTTIEPQDILEQAMTEHYAGYASSFDPSILHLSDLTNCVRAVWYRRNGYNDTPITPQRRLTMVRGLAIEREIGAALARQLEAHGYVVYFDSSSNGLGQRVVWLDVTPDLYMEGGFADTFVPLRAARGHLDFYAEHAANKHAYIGEVKSLPFLGPAPMTKHVMQANAYAAAIRSARPDFTVDAHVIEVSAVTGEYRAHLLDADPFANEIRVRVAERQWTTAAGDVMPEPSIPDEMFATRGRAPNKQLVNLLCEKYCGYRVCDFNHVGEATVTSEE